MSKPIGDFKDGNGNLKSPQQEQIQIAPVLEKDSDEVLQLLKRFFYKDEPINDYIKLGASEELDKYTTKSLIDNCSFKAVNSRGEIVGVIVNAIINKPNPNDPVQSKAAECKEAKFKKILTLFEYIDGQFDTFDMYPNIDKLLDVALLSVNTDYRRCGISVKLLEKTIEYARENKISVIKVLCSSFYSAKLCKKFAFKNVYSLPYADYKVDGNIVFLPKNPHEIVELYLHEVN